MTCECTDFGLCDPCRATIRAEVAATRERRRAAGCCLDCGVRLRVGDTICWRCVRIFDRAANAHAIDEEEAARLEDLMAQVPREPDECPVCFRPEPCHDHDGGLYDRHLYGGKWR